MKLKVILLKEKKEIKLKFNGKVSALLDKLKIEENGVLIIRNGELVNGADEVKNEDLIKIMPVISGG